MKSKTIWSIYKNASLVESYDKFDKDTVNAMLHETILQSKNGDEIEFGREDKKYAYAPMLLLEIREGKPYHGNRRWYWRNKNNELISYEQ